MKDDRIKISVGVITYNQESTIRQTLDSILTQKGEFDMELVIGEDCSTDNTHAICEEYVRCNELRNEGVNELREVKLLPNTQNLGIMANFARVMKACTGGYVGICAGDDYWCDDRKLEKQLKFMEANPQYGVCCTSGYRLMVETGNMIDGIEPLNPVPDGDVSKYYKDRISGIYAQPLSLLIKKELLRYIDFDEYIRRGFPLEDYPMQSVLAHHTLFGHIPDKTSVYRISSKSTTFTSFESSKYMDFHKGLVDIRRYLHGLFPEDVPFTEEWATEYVLHKEYLKYVWFGQYKEAKAVWRKMDPASELSKKNRWIVANRLFFYCFVKYKHIVYNRSIKKRTN